MKISDYSYETASPDRYSILKEHARSNRTYPTDAEYVLWQYLRKSQLGVKFRRQHAINDYIVGFVCLDQMLVIEVDGGYHENPDQKQQDEQRSEILEQYGYRVIRFVNEDIYNNIEDVIGKIKESIV